MADRKTSWRIGELAEATGLTVRTLHHYEHIGLLSPATRTEGQQRLYSEHDVRRLYRIRSLRDLGLSLADIGHMLDDTDGTTLGDILRDHLARVEVELDRLKQLRTLLDRACIQATRIEEPDDVLAAIEAMAQVTRRINAGATPQTQGDDVNAEEAWRALGNELRACMEAEEPPSSPRVREIARAVHARLLEFAGGDRATLDALASLRELDPPEDLAGWDPPLMRYLNQALALIEENEC